MSHRPLTTMNHTNSESFSGSIALSPLSRMICLMFLHRLSLQAFTTYLKKGRRFENLMMLSTSIFFRWSSDRDSAALALSQI